MKWILLSLVGFVVWVLVGWFVWSSLASAACEPEPITVNTPTGIAGCEVWGEGTASHYGPGNGVAMNFCTWELRHTQGCGKVRIVSLDTGIDTVVPVVDFCDCYTGTPRQRIVDLQYGVVAALGLDLSQGLYLVRVERAGIEQEIGTAGTSLPDTAMQPHGRAL